MTSDTGLGPLQIAYISRQHIHLAQASPLRLQGIPLLIESQNLEGYRPKCRTTPSMPPQSPKTPTSPLPSDSEKQNTTTAASEASTLPLLDRLLFLAMAAGILLSNFVTSASRPACLRPPAPRNDVPHPVRAKHTLKHPREPPSAAVISGSSLFFRWL